MTPTSTKPRRRAFHLNDATDRRQVEALFAMQQIRHEELSDLSAMLRRLLAPTGVPMPAAMIAGLGPDLAHWSLGTGQLDRPTITLAAAVTAGSTSFLHPERDPLGFRRFLFDLVAHEAAHHIHHVRGWPHSEHGVHFVRSCAQLAAAHGEGTKPGRLPYVRPGDGAGWPMSHRSPSHYGAAVSARWLAGVRRRAA